MSIGRNRLALLRRLARIPNARLVDAAHVLARAHPRAPTAVVVISSTVGLEALLHGRPVLTLGQPFYSGYGVTLDVDSFREIRDGRAGGAALPPDRERTLRFLARGDARLLARQAGARRPLRRERARAGGLARRRGARRAAAAARARAAAAPTRVSPLRVGLELTVLELDRGGIARSARARSRDELAARDDVELVTFAQPAGAAAGASRAGSRASSRGCPFELPRRARRARRRRPALPVAARAARAASRRRSW